jgi:hypothetical protein
LLGEEAGGLLGEEAGGLLAERAGGTLVPEPGTVAPEFDGAVELVLLPEGFLAVGELSQAASDSASTATAISHFPFIISSPFGLRFSAKAASDFVARSFNANGDGSAKIPGLFLLIGAINRVLPARRSVPTGTWLFSGGRRHWRERCREK